MRLAHIAITLFVLACSIGVLAWFALVWNLFRISFSLKPGVRPWSNGNPFNHIFHKESLTPSGLLARRRVGTALLVFVSAIVFAALVGAITRLLA